MGRWSEEAIWAEARKYQSRSEFSKKSNAAFQAARRRGMLDDLHTVQTNGRGDPPGQRFWTAERIRGEALKYFTRSDFFKANPTAYQGALKLGIFSEVCAHMENLRPPKLEPDEVRAAASKCSSRSELAATNRRAYEAARRLAILDELFPK